MSVASSTLSSHLCNSNPRTRTAAHELPSTKDPLSERQPTWGHWVMGGLAKRIITLSGGLGICDPGLHHQKFLQFVSQMATLPTNSSQVLSAHVGQTLCWQCYQELN